jgi:hypothetical protein
MGIRGQAMMQTMLQEILRNMPQVLMLALSMVGVEDFIHPAILNLDSSSRPLRSTWTVQLTPF